MDEIREQLADALGDRYRLQGVVGQGGMATVFLADEVGPDRKVAIKVLDPEATSLITRRRFLLEIEVAGRLVHPNIVPIYTAGKAGELLYCVMPFIEGDSLRRILQRRGAMPFTEALGIAAETAAALEFAHRDGIVHRDIKPENILISDGHAMVTDFGIAKAFKDASALKLTQAGVALGTPTYMSPEQARGIELGPASDVYSLGLVLFEMLTGAPPFSGHPREVMQHHARSRPPRLRSRRGPIPPGVTALVGKALAKEPGERFESAGEMAAQIEELLETAAIQPSTPRGGRLGLQLTAAATAILLAGAAFWALRGDPVPSAILVADLENHTGIVDLDSLGRVTAAGISDGLARWSGSADEAPETIVRRVSAERDSLLREAAATGARAIVHGAYYLQTDTLRFHLVVTDASSGTIVGAPEPVLVPLGEGQSAAPLLSEAVSAILEHDRGAPAERP